MYDKWRPVNISYFIIHCFTVFRRDKTSKYISHLFDVIMWHSGKVPHHLGDISFDLSESRDINLQFNSYAAKLRHIQSFFLSACLKSEIINLPLFLSSGVLWKFPLMEPFKWKDMLFRIFVFLYLFLLKSFQTSPSADIQDIYQNH